MNDLTEQVLKEIAKEYGEDIIYDGQTILDNKSEVISVSPSLDVGLNGGIPLGSFVVCVGWEKRGKTTIALHLAKKCQQKNMQVFYLDIEHRLKPKNLAGCLGLKLKKPDLTIIQSGKPNEIEGKAANILTAEKFLQLAERILKTVPRCLVIIDSLSQLLEEKQTTENIGDGGRDGGPKLLAQFCKRIAPILCVNKSIVFGVVQLMSNTGNSAKFQPTVEKGGNAIKYAHDIKLKVRTDKDWKTADDQPPFGQITTWVVEESALGPPGRLVESYHRFGKGIDEVYELVKFGEEVGLIVKSGSWYTLNFATDEKQSKAQGIDKVYQLVLERPELVTQLQDALDKMMGLDR